MSLSALLQYDDSDDEAADDHSNLSSSPPPLPPSLPGSVDTALLPLASPPPPSSVPSLVTESVGGEKKRKRPLASDTLSFLSTPTVPSSTPSAPSTSPASASASPSAPHELFSLLPPPKGEAPFRPIRASGGSAAEPRSPHATSPQPSPSPATTAVPLAPTPSLHSHSAAAPSPPPPGMKRPLHASSVVLSSQAVPSSAASPQLFPVAPIAPQLAAAHSASALTPPRIAYSTSSPYAVASQLTAASPLPLPSSTTALATPWDEPRLLRQFAEASNFIDVRVDDLTSPPTFTSSVPSSTPTPSDLKLRTTYWNAKEGKEVVVDGVQGRQKRVHQINALALQAKAQEADILNARAASSNIRRMARAKYGW